MSEKLQIIICRMLEKGKEEKTKGYKERAENEEGVSREEGTETHCPKIGLSTVEPKGGPVHGCKGTAYLVRNVIRRQFAQHIFR